VLRWVLWLLAGVLTGVAAGFLAGLGASDPDLQRSEDDGLGSRPSDVAGVER
jgi:hypothetical protein